jgi:tetratricopeptide (TPR) repeat protein
MMKTLAGLLKPGVVALLLLCAGCASNRGGDDFTERYEQAGKYYRSGLYSDAERLLLDLHRRSPNHYEVLFRLGNIYVRTGQFEAAESAYQRCIGIDPEQPKGWYNLSLLRVKQAMYLTEEGRARSRSKAPDFTGHFDRLEQGLMAAIGSGER